jgi:hypothetical protein
MLVLAIFPEAFLRECTFRILPEVHLAFPAFVCPGGGPKANERRENHGRVYRLSSHILNGLVSIMVLFYQMTDHSNPSPSIEDFRSSGNGDLGCPLCRLGRYLFGCRSRRWLVRLGRMEHWQARQSARRKPSRRVSAPSAVSAQSPIFPLD